MTEMIKPTFLINKYIQENSTNLDELKNKLYKEGIHMKNYDKDGLFQLYHKYDTPCNNTMQRECRSVIFDNKTLNMVAYTGEVPMLNNEGLSYMLSTDSPNYYANISYEGSLLSIFYFNDKWYVSTRRCLDSNESKFNSDKSHYDMFCDVILNDSYETPEHFFEKLDKNLSYYFVLIHHMNKNIIDYTYKFGENYTKACLINVRNKNQKILDGFTPSFIHDSVYKSFFVPERISLRDFDKENSSLDYSTQPLIEGIVIEVYMNDNTLKRMIIKLQTLHYQFYQTTKINDNVLKGLLLLYKNNKLFNYLENPKLKGLRKIHNPNNSYESYNIINTFSAVFKVCSSELFDLFKKLWDIRNGQHKNKELYDILPKEYKELLFKIRGIYYDKKTTFMNKKTTSTTQYLESHLKYSDIYNLLKNIDIDGLYSFLRMRKIMLTKYAQPNELYKVFLSMSDNCDSSDLKLVDIVSESLCADSSDKK